MTDLDARLQAHRRARIRLQGQRDRLSVELHELVREAKRAGLGVQASADALGVSRQSIHDILKRKEG